MEQIHLFVSGELRGVCYRYYSAKKAKDLGLKGFVRNVPDGRVEVLAEGEESRVDEFVNFCKNNPGYAKVEKIELKEEKEARSSIFENFEIRY